MEIKITNDGKENQDSFEASAEFTEEERQQVSSFHRETCITISGSGSSEEEARNVLNQVLKEITEKLRGLIK